MNCWSFAASFSIVRRSFSPAACFSIGVWPRSGLPQRCRSLLSCREISFRTSCGGWWPSKPKMGFHSWSRFQNHTSPSTPLPIGGCRESPDEFSSWSIANLELVAHVVAFHLWAPEWERQHVTVHTDNQACFWLLTKGRSREDLRLRISRWLAMEQVFKNFHKVSEWSPTTENFIADALSRPADPKQHQAFHDYCRNLAGAPSRCHVEAVHFDLNLDSL